MYTSITYQLCLRRLNSSHLYGITALCSQLKPTLFRRRLFLFHPLPRSLPTTPTTTTTTSIQSLTAMSTTAAEQKEISSKSGAMKPVERGHAYFLFRPKVDVSDAHSFKDGQHRYITQRLRQTHQELSRLQLCHDLESHFYTCVSFIDIIPHVLVQKLYLWLAPERVEMADHVTHAIGAEVPRAVRRKHKDTPLSHEFSKTKAQHRLLIIPSKKLPVGGQPLWAFVDTVGDTVQDIKNVLGEFHYHTKTRGERTGHACRIVGEALYEISRDNQHTYFFYELELPEAPEEPQHAFNIQKEAVVLCQAKNPHAAAVSRDETPAPGLGEGAAPKYPKHLQECFKGKRVPETKFAPLMPEMLNYKGTELLLLGVKHSPQELGFDPKEVEALENYAEMEAEAMKGRSEKEILESTTGIETKPALHSF